jgi:hypothetical protein
MRSPDLSGAQDTRPFIRDLAGRIVFRPRSGLMGWVRAGVRGNAILGRPPICGRIYTLLQIRVTDRRNAVRLEPLFTNVVCENHQFLELLKNQSSKAPKRQASFPGTAHA